MWIKAAYKYKSEYKISLRNVEINFLYQLLLNLNIFFHIGGDNSKDN